MPAESLGELPLDKRLAAFAPRTDPPTDDGHTLRCLGATNHSRRTARPSAPVEPTFTASPTGGPPETHVAWRREVELVTGALIERHPPADLLEDYPLKPYHELLHDRSDRVFKELAALAERKPDLPAWVMDDYGTAKVTTLEKLEDKSKGIVSTAAPSSFPERQTVRGTARRRLDECGRCRGYSIDFS